MLSFAPRCALPSRIGAAVYDKILSSSEVLGKDATHDCIKADCDTLQGLRTQIEQDSEGAGIEVLLEYLSCLQSTLLKLDLELYGFVWTNSIGCSRAPVQGVGLRYECLNVLFNIASHYMRHGAQFAGDKHWQSAKEAFQMASGVLIRAREVELHQLSHSPPVELQDSTLAFLYCLNIAQATECQLMISMDPSQAWSARIKYQKLVKSSAASPLLSIWTNELESKARHLGSLACLSASMVFRNSRKQTDHAMEYAALLQALDFAVDDEVRARIHQAIEAPRGRQKKTLASITHAAKFEETNYFKSASLVGPIDFCVPKPQNAMLAQLLPLTIASAPLILSEKLKDYVEKGICSKLYNINRYTRSIMVKCTSPCNLELFCNPNAPPKSLLRIAHRMRKRGGLKNLQDLLELGYQEARHCDAIIASVQSLHTDKDEYKALQRCAVAGMRGLQIIQSKLDRSGSLIELLERGESSVAQFIGISRNSVFQQQRLTALNRRGPSELVKKSEAFFAALGERIYMRSQKSAMVEKKAREYNFFGPVMSVVTSCDQPKNWSLKDLTGCFEDALAEFEPEIEALQAEKLQAEEDSQTLLRLGNELRKLRRQYSCPEDDKVKAVQTLMFAALQFYDISYNLTESHRYYNALNTAVTNFKDRCNNSAFSIGTTPTIPDINSAPQESMWKPGMSIEFI